MKRLMTAIPCNEEKNKRNKGLEVPYLVKVKAAFNVCSKAETIIRDLLKRLM